MSPETNHDLPLADLKKLIKAAPLLTKLRVAYIKNINAAFVRLVATQCPLLEVFDVNAGGMVKGLGPGGEAALLELAGKCRRGSASYASRPVRSSTAATACVNSGSSAAHWVRPHQQWLDVRDAPLGFHAWSAQRIRFLSE